jgi:hypothetical protein
MTAGPRRRSIGGRCNGRNGNRPVHRHSCRRRPRPARRPAAAALVEAGQAVPRAAVRRRRRGARCADRRHGRDEPPEPVAATRPGAPARGGVAGQGSSSGVPGVGRASGPCGPPGGCGCGKRSRTGRHGPERGAPVTAARGPLAAQNAPAADHRAGALHRPPWTSPFRGKTFRGEGVLFRLRYLETFRASVVVPPLGRSPASRRRRR